MPLIEPKSDCKEFAKLNFAAQNFYWTLRTHLDAMGRHRAEPEILISTLFPLKRSHVRCADISRWLAECQKAGVLRCYADTKGRSIVEVKDGVQRMRNQSSKLEPYEGGQSSLALEGPPKAPPPNGKEGNRKEGKGSARIEDGGASRTGNLKMAGTSDTSPPAPNDSPVPTGSALGGPLPPRQIPSSASQASEVPSRCGEGGVGPDSSRSVSPLEALRAQLNKVYKREADERWSHIEEHELLEISRRKNWAAELEHILTYRRLVFAREEIRFFPNSIYSLLSKWTEALDKARVQCPKPKVVDGTQGGDRVVAPRATPHSKAVTAEEIKSSIVYLQESMPTAASLPGLLERYKAMTGQDLGRTEKTVLR